MFYIFNVYIYICIYIYIYVIYICIHIYINVKWIITNSWRVFIVLIWSKHGVLGTSFSAFAISNFSVRHKSHNGNPHAMLHSMVIFSLWSSKGIWKFWCFFYTTVCEWIFMIIILTLSSFSVDIAWLWHFLVNLYIELTISTSYGSVPGN